MIFLFHSGRTVSQGSFIDRKNSREYQDETSCCRMNPVDVYRLGILDGDRILLENAHGSVVCTVCEDRNMTEGQIFLPLGPYANQLIPGTTQSTGMPDFKSVDVQVTPTIEPVAGVGDLMTACGGVKYEGR